MHVRTTDIAMPLRKHRCLKDPWHAFQVLTSRFSILYMPLHCRYSTSFSSGHETNLQHGAAVMSACGRVSQRTDTHVIAHISAKI